MIANDEAGLSTTSFLGDDPEVEAGEVGREEAAEDAAGGGLLDRGERPVALVDVEEAGQVGGLDRRGGAQAEEEEEEG